MQNGSSLRRICRSQRLFFRIVMNVTNRHSVSDEHPTSIASIMRDSWPRTKGIIVRGRIFFQSDLVLIRKLIRTHPSWGRTKLSEKVCQVIGWRQENGRLKDRGCRVALSKLESLGFLKLPAKKTATGGQPPRQLHSVAISEAEILKMPSEIRLHQVTSVADSRLWNSLIGKFHYLGLATPVGRLIRYLICGDNQPIGAISFSDPAWSQIGRASCRERV